VHVTLFHPHETRTPYPDDRTGEVMRSLVDFFETRGKARLKEDDHGAVWYQDFLDHVAANRLFATMCTPSGYGGDDTRWDTWRNCEFGEILGFYGLPYWYTWQVSVLGLGPIWMSPNEAMKERVATMLDDGGIFAFGLSEQAHGADLYSSEMMLTPQHDGTWLANGSKYYIGNANAAAVVSTFGRMADTGEWVFFAASPDRPEYTCVQNVVRSQNFVAEYRLDDYVVTEGDILIRSDEAWDAALKTVNIG
jgi:acyl-CoA dehydrogenase